MFKPHRTRAFLRAYRYLPHRALGRVARALARAERPRWAVDLAIRAWIRRGDLDLREYVPGPWPSLEAFFLRRLRPGARPLAPGLVSPADGVVVGTGPIDQGTILQVKGAPLRLARVLGGDRLPTDLAALAGGRYVTVFLTPDGYHRLHMPCDAVVAEVRSIPGRFFPQNVDALREISGVYERNERAALRCVRPGGGAFWLVLVGASLIGGIELEGLDRRTWAAAPRHAWGRRFARGDELARFTFGSTVILALPPGMLEGPGPALGAAIRVGERLG